MAPRVFLVTGTSSGFGKHLIDTILAHGDIAIATARKPDQLSFEGTTEKNFQKLKLDVTDKKEVAAVFEEAVKRWGKVDVVVNNAGFGLAGPFEELSEAQMRTQMEVNFWGVINVTRVALESMRKTGGGLIQQITSIGGQRGVPMFSIYCASKWAVEGMTEAISHELKPEWGIKLTCVEPGGFRTDWAGRSMAFAEERHPAYDHINAKEQMEQRNGKQVGDPVKAARAMYELAVMKDPPLRVVVGSDAYKAIMGKIESYKDNYQKYEKLSNSTDVDEN